MANLNRVLLIGRLTRDPELRYTPGGLPIAEFGFACNNRRKGQDGNWVEEPVFVDITAFGRTAELVNQYLAKGRQAFIEGHLKFDQWTSQEGQKRSKLGVVVDNLQFLDSGGEGRGGGGAGGSRAPAARDQFEEPADGGYAPQPPRRDSYPPESGGREPNDDIPF